MLIRLGRLGVTKGPGWYWLIPFIDRVVKVDVRTVTVQLETQETITRDGVAVQINAVRRALNSDVSALAGYLVDERQ